MVDVIEVPRGSPSLKLLVMEPLRAAVEYARMRFMDAARRPQGDGHPVVIFPGLCTDRRSIEPLRRWCEALGYASYDWGRGFNTGPQGDVDEWLDALASDVKALGRRHRRRVSLIGWSLGGIYAREIAKVCPDGVRQVISIGSPFAGTGTDTNVGWLYRLVSGNTAVIDDELASQLRESPPVPTTSIYSRTDGIVAWHACRESPTLNVENVEVDGSHVGLPWNPGVLDVVAERLNRTMPARRARRSIRATCTSVRRSPIRSTCPTQPCGHHVAPKARGHTGPTRRRLGVLEASVAGRTVAAQQAEQ